MNYYLCVCVNFLFELQLIRGVFSSVGPLGFFLPEFTGHRNT